MRMDDSVLDLAGLDMDRISVLANAFSDKMTYLRISDTNHRTDLVNHITNQFNVVESNQQERGYFIDKKTNHKVEITEDTFIVGKTRRKCHHCIEDDSNVSVVHFSILSSPKGNMIMDFGAMNGTYVNGRRIASMTPVPIYDLDEIDFGDQTYVFRLS